MNISEFIESKEPSNRMVFVDSSGGLVKITKQMHDGYKRDYHLH